MPVTATVATAALGAAMAMTAAGQIHLRQDPAAEDVARSGWRRPAWRWCASAGSPSAGIWWSIVIANSYVLTNSSGYLFPITPAGSLSGRFVRFL